MSLGCYVFCRFNLFSGSCISILIEVVAQLSQKLSMLTLVQTEDVQPLFIGFTEFLDYSLSYVIKIESCSTKINEIASSCLLIEYICVHTLMFVFMCFKCTIFIWWVKVSWWISCSLLYYSFCNIYQCSRILTTFLTLNNVLQCLISTKQYLTMLKNPIDLYFNIQSTEFWKILEDYYDPSSFWT